MPSGQKFGHLLAKFGGSLFVSSEVFSPATETELLPFLLCLPSKATGADSRKREKEVPQASGYRDPRKYPTGRHVRINTGVKLPSFGWAPSIHDQSPGSALEVFFSLSSWDGNLAPCPSRTSIVDLDLRLGFLLVLFIYSSFAGNGNQRRTVTNKCYLSPYLR